MKVGLAEMQYFAAGASSRSTKHVHGGLRYLKQFEVDLGHNIVYENRPEKTLQFYSKVRSYFSSFDKNYGSHFLHKTFYITPSGNDYVIFKFQYCRYKSKIKYFKISY